MNDKSLQEYVERMATIEKGYQMDKFTSDEHALAVIASINEGNLLSPDVYEKLHNALNQQARILKQGPVKMNEKEKNMFFAQLHRSMSGPF